MAADTDNDLPVAATTVFEVIKLNENQNAINGWIRPWIVQRPISGAYHALLHGVLLAVTLHYIKSKNRCNLIQK